LQEQLDALNDTLQEKEAEIAGIRVELENITLEVQTFTKENGQLSMQFADMKMAADRVRYESTEQALVIETLTTENSVIRGELQLLQDQIKTLQEEQAQRQQDEESSTPTPDSHTNTKSSPVKHYSAEWALKEEQLKRDLEDGFRSSADEETPPPAEPTLSSAEVQTRITELEEAIKIKDMQFEEEQQKYNSMHTVLASQHTQLQAQHSDLRSQLQARDAEIEMLKAKLEEKSTSTNQGKQEEGTDTAQDEAPSEEPAEQRLLQELAEQPEEEVIDVELPTEERIEKHPTDLPGKEDGAGVVETSSSSSSEAGSTAAADFEHKLSSQAAEIEKLISENNVLRAQLQEVPKEPVDIDKYNVHPTPPPPNSLCLQLSPFIPSFC
jgi:hypothetical protein